MSHAMVCIRDRDHCLKGRYSHHGLLFPQDYAEHKTKEYEHLLENKYEGPGDNFVYDEDLCESPSIDGDSQQHMCV